MASNSEPNLRDHGDTDVGGPVAVESDGHDEQRSDVRASMPGEFQSTRDATELAARYVELERERDLLAERVTAAVDAELKVLYPDMSPEEARERHKAEVATLESRARDFLRTEIDEEEALIGLFVGN